MQASDVKAFPCFSKIAGIDTKRDRAPTLRKGAAAPNRVEEIFFVKKIEICVSFTE